MRVFHRYIINSKESIPKISKKTGINEGELSAIKSQKLFPSYENLRKLSKFFKTPVSELLKEAQESSHFNFLYRKSTDVDFVVIDKFQIFISNILKLGCDTQDIIPIRYTLKPTDDSLRSAEKMAIKFRQLFLDGDLFSPIVDLPKLLSDKLGFVVKVIEGGNKIDGASTYMDGWVFLFVSPRFEGRMLFTLAHELAHVINHHNSGNFFYYDSKITGTPRNIRNSQEGFANAFASALLLPVDGIARMLKKIRELNRIPEDRAIGDIEILYLSRFYGVSFEVAAYRLELLDLIPQGGSYSLAKKIKEIHGSPEKRANELELPARQIPNFNVLPKFIVRRALDLIEENSYSVEKMAQMLSIPVSQLIKYNAEFEGK